MGSRAQIKARLLAEFLPTGMDAAVIELIIDESSFDEAESRRHLTAMAADLAGSRTAVTDSPVSRPDSRGYRGVVLRSTPATASATTPATAAATATAMTAAPTPASAALSVTQSPLQQKLAAGAPLLVLMRGLPGSGKSTLARQLAGPHGCVVSADDYFVDRQGRYRFQRERLSEAHGSCQHRTRQALRRGVTPVIVDNTNTEMWEMKPYAEMAAQFGYYLEILEPNTPWRRDPTMLTRKTVHGVPRASIENMLARFQGSEIVNVSALYRLIDMVPKPWPPPLPPAGEAAVASTGLTAGSEAPPAGGSSQRPPARSQPADSHSVTATAMSTAVDAGWAAAGAAAARQLWSEQSPRSGPTAAAAAAGPLETAAAGTQTGGGGDGGRLVSSRPWRGSDATGAGELPPLRVPLHRGTMTSPPPPATPVTAVAGLRAMFPSVSDADLQHILEQCDGDVNWATNLLLDSNLEPAAVEAAPATEAAAEPVPEAEGPAEAVAMTGAETAHGARPKWPPVFQRQSSEDSGPDVIVEDLSDSEQELGGDIASASSLRSAAAAIDTGANGNGGGRDGDVSSTSSSGCSTPSQSTDAQFQLSLTLPPLLAYQLQELFGPTAFGPRTESQLAQLPAAELTVQLPVELARQLHHCWLAGADRAFDAEQQSFEQLRAQVDTICRHQEEQQRQATLLSDAEMARQLQQEEDGRMAERNTARARPAAASPTPQLRDIMALQEALQLSEKTGGETSQAYRLTRQRLREEFPGVDPSYLDELLDMHDGEYRQVLQVLRGTRDELPLPVASLQPLPPSPPQATGGALGGADALAGEAAADFLTEFGGLPSFSDIRAESEVYRQQMRHAQTMAARAVRRNLPGVSQYYVQERDRLAACLKECNTRAALTTLELRQDGDPDRLDLHHVLVDEALVQLAGFIAERQLKFGQQGIKAKKVSVITGRGKNSKNGKPKIKPAVQNWLRNKGVRFEEAPGNPGMLLVHVESEHLYRPAR